MARGKFWLCTELRLIRANMDKPDRVIAEMLPGRSARAVEDFRRKQGLAKPTRHYPGYPTYPQVAGGRTKYFRMVQSTNGQDVGSIG